MINGFEEQTHELTEYELSLVPVFVKGFQKKIGKANAVTNKQILSKLRPEYKLSDARIRKIINYLRREEILPGLIANSKGYYISTDPDEVKEYVESLGQRANEILRIKRSFSNYLLKISA